MIYSGGQKKLTTYFYSLLKFKKLLTTSSFGSYKFSFIFSWPLWASLNLSKHRKNFQARSKSLKKVGMAFLMYFVLFIVFCRCHVKLLNKIQFSITFITQTFLSPHFSWFSLKNLHFNFSSRLASEIAPVIPQHIVYTSIWICKVFFLFQRSAVLHG